ncbi:hypothetical protein, partial [uncultured Bacteroides sp.]|uniref:hypothetical protein n=1 Tax=uncultured Bacteroides sp. TaxID=162156 RepID=UPI0025B033C6
AVLEEAPESEMTRGLLLFPHHTSHILVIVPIVYIGQLYSQVVDRFQFGIMFEYDFRTYSLEVSPFTNVLLAILVCLFSFSISFFLPSFCILGGIFL